MPTPDYYVADEGPSFAAGWDLAHSRFAREDEERRAWLNVAARGPYQPEMTPQERGRLGGRPRGPQVCACGGKVYARARCRSCYDAARRAG